MLNDDDRAEVRALIDQAGVPVSPGILREFTVLRASLLLLAEDTGAAVSDLDGLRDGSHPFAQRLDGDLSGLRATLDLMHGGVAEVSTTLAIVAAGVERLVRLADHGSSPN